MLQNSAVSLLILTLASASSAQDAQILAIENIVQVAKGGTAAWTPATDVQPLSISDRIRTRQKSRATVKLTDLYTMRMEQFTTIEISPKLVSGGKPQLDISGGAAFIFSREEFGEIGIKTPAANGTLKGTQLFVQVSGGRTLFQVIEGSVEMQNPHGQVILNAGEAGEATPGRAPKKTASIMAKNILQWALYYPAVIDPSELGMGATEELAVAESLAAYREGDLLGALEKYPNRTPENTGGKLYKAGVLLAVGRVDEAGAILRSLDARHSGRHALERMIAAVTYTPSTDVSITITDDENPSASIAGEMAESYYQQSRGNLEAALAASRKAVAAAPENGYAWTRVGELEFSFGRTAEARQALERGLTLTPKNAQAHALHGFVLSADSRIREAHDAFDEAIRLDGALGKAWLGRGLVRIKSGHHEQGRADLQTAATVEPTSAIFHSYLAKAFSAEGRTADVRKDLALAIQLDPNDPTPWLYSAVQNQQEYRYNTAIGDLEESIRLNDNRRIYRSKFLLDQDRAVRSANLAKIYQNAGMTEVSVREAARAVESDYTNPSAHLFLANSFDALRDPQRIELRQETPWFNELLLANLLGPVGGGPLSQFVSQEEYSKLLEADGSGGSFTSEWRSDSEQRSTASAFGTYGHFSYGIDASYYDSSGDRLNSDASRTEIYGQFKWQVTPDDVFYFLGKWQDQEAGDNFKTYDHQPISPEMRFDETQEPGLLLGGWNHRWAPGSNTLFLGGRLGINQEQTDPNSRQNLLLRDPSGLRPGFVRKVNGDDVYADPGLRNASTPPVRLGPDGQSLIYSPALLKAIDPYLGTGRVIDSAVGIFDFATQRQFEIYTAELQHIQQTDWNTLIAGARWQGGEYETDTRLLFLGPSFSGGLSTPAADQHSVTDSQRISFYAYDYYSPVSWLTLIGGVAWDHLEHPDNFRSPPVNDGQREEQQFSGKLGFTMTPSPWIHLRGMYAEGLGGVTFDESVRLEPSQIAGFSQAYRTVISESLVGSVEAPLFKTWGMGIDGMLPSKTWWGASFNVIEQDVDRTVGAFSGYDLGVFPNNPAYFPDGTSQQLAYRESSIGATVNQLIGDEFSVGLSYLITRSDLRNTYPELIGVPDVTASRKDRATLQELSISGNWNSPSGFFATVEANAFAQDLNDDPSRFAPGAPPRDEDSFWQFNALVGYRFWRNQGSVTLGLLNIADTDYHLSPLTPYGEIVRERTAVVACRLSF